MITARLSASRKEGKDVFTVKVSGGFLLKPGVTPGIASGEQPESPPPGVM